MKEQTIKEAIIKEIRQALLEKNDIENISAPTELNVASQPTAADADLAIAFVKQFSQQGGTLYYCTTEEEIGEQLRHIQQQHNNAVIGCCNNNLSGFIQHLNIDNVCTATAEKQYSLGALLCESLMAEDGGIIISDKQGFGTSMPTLPPVTILIAFTSQTVNGWETAMARLKETYKAIPNQVLVLQPGQTDIKLYLILVDDEN